MVTLDTIKKNFTKNGFAFNYFDDVDKAVDYIISLIPSGCSIGFGGSVTVKEINLLDKLISLSEHRLLHRDLVQDLPKDELYSQMHNADWYISGTNALCETGELVNIDGRANRVAAMLNGPRNVIIISGINKIVPDVQSGIDRVRNVASPLNAKRLNKKTPCAITGKCSYCNSPDCICCATVIQHHPTFNTKTHIILINKNLGF